MTERAHAIDGSRPVHWRTSETDLWSVDRVDRSGAPGLAGAAALDGRAARDGRAAPAALDGRAAPAARAARDGRRRELVRQVGFVEARSA